MSGDGKSDDADFVLKVILVGDSGVGKSSFLRAYMGDPFNVNLIHTVGVDFEIKKVDIGQKSVSLQIWDTAGHERFRTITTSYYRSSDAILLMFDVTREESFRNLESWLEDIQLYGRENVDIVLLGNKVDLEDERQITFEQGKAFAESHGIATYAETSSKEHVNVDESFVQVATQAVQSKVQQQRKRKSLASSGKELLDVRGAQIPDGPGGCIC